MSEPSGAKLTFQFLHRPLPYRLLDFSGSCLEKLGAPIAETNLRELLERATKITNLDDFGDRRFEEPLSCLIESLKGEAELNFIGRYIMKKMLLELLCERLRVQDVLQQSPAICSEQINKPLFVIGLPRSGTTFLFNLLCQDPNSLWIKHWELSVAPRPFPDSDREAKFLIEQCDRDLEILNFLVPHLNAVHPINVTGPDECFHLLTGVLPAPCLLFTATFPPTFNGSSLNGWGTTEKNSSIYIDTIASKFSSSKTDGRDTLTLQLKISQIQVIGSSNLQLTSPP